MGHSNTEIDVVSRATYFLICSWIINEARPQPSPPPLTMNSIK
jgi:hypothetical protein